MSESVGKGVKGELMSRLLWATGLCSAGDLLKNLWNVLQDLPARDQKGGALTPVLPSLVRVSPGV